MDANARREVNTWREVGLRVRKDEETSSSEGRPEKRKKRRERHREKIKRGIAEKKYLGGSVHMRGRYPNAGKEGDYFFKGA